MESVVWVLIEAFLEVFGGVVVEVIAHWLPEWRLANPGPWLSGLGLALLGALFGGLSLLAFPHLLAGPPWRVANLVVSPLMAGLVAVALGAWRRQRGDAVLRIDHFAWGGVFAFTMALTRFLFAH